MSQDNKEKMGTKNSQMVKITLVSLLAVSLFLIEIYEIIHDPANMIVIGALGVFLLASVCAGMLLIRKQMDENAKGQEEAFDNVYRSEKASYLLLKKYFDQMEQKMASLSEPSDLPYKELIAAQKALAKAQINRGKQNTNALLISNDRLMQRINSIQKDIANLSSNTSESNQGLSEQDQAVFAEGNRQVLDKQQEILDGLKVLETSLRNEILESADKMASMKSQQMSVPQRQNQILDQEDIQPLDIDDDFSFDHQLDAPQISENSSESDLDKLLMQMDGEESVDAQLGAGTVEPAIPELGDLDSDFIQPIMPDAEPELEPMMLDAEPELEPMMPDTEPELEPIMPDAELELEPMPELDLPPVMELDALSIDESEAAPIQKEEELQSLENEPELAPIMEEPILTPDIETEQQTAVLEDQELQSLFAQSELQPISSEPELQSMTGEAGSASVMEEPELQQIAEESGLAPLMDEPELTPITEESGLASVMSEPELQPVIEEPALAPIMDEPELQLITDDLGLAPIMGEPELQPGIEEPGLASEINEPELQPISEEGLDLPPVMDAELPPIAEEPESDAVIEPELPPIAEEILAAADRNNKPASTEAELQAMIDRLKPKEPEKVKSLSVEPVEEPEKSKSLSAEPVEETKQQAVPENDSREITPDRLAAMVANLGNEPILEEPEPIKEESKPIEMSTLQPAAQNFMEAADQPVVTKPVAAQPESADATAADDELEEIMKAMDIDMDLGQSVEDMDIDKILEVPMSNDNNKFNVNSSPNQVMSSDEIAALIANTELLSEPEPIKNADFPDLSDPSYVMSSDEIAALIANM